MAKDTVTLALELESRLPERIEEPLPVEVIDIRHDDALRKLERFLDGVQGWLALDFETVSDTDPNTEIHYQVTPVLSCALCNLGRIVVLASPTPAPDEVWKPLLERLVDMPLAIHNASYDARFLWRITGKLPQEILDTMVLYGLVSSGRGITTISKQQSLAAVTKALYLYEMDKAVRETFSADRFTELDEQQLRYAAEDVFWTELIAHRLLRLAEDYEHVVRLECRLTPVLIRMEAIGIPIDLDRVRMYADQMSDLENALRRRILEHLSKDDRIAVAIDIENSGEYGTVTLGEVSEQLLLGKDPELRPLASFMDFYEVRLYQDLSRILRAPAPASSIVNLNAHRFWNDLIRFVTGGGHRSSAAKSVESLRQSLRNGAARTRYDRMYDLWFADLLELLTDLRAVAKIRSTYLDAWIEKAGADARGICRIHTRFMQTFAESGRLSSRSPNLQNCPRPETTQFLARYMQEPPNMRDMFVAEPGKLLITADYSQYELRVAAERAGESAMIETYVKDYEIRQQIERLLLERYGLRIWHHKQIEQLEDEELAALQQELKRYDLHTANAARVFRKRPEEVTKVERSLAKTISFGVLYGMRAPALAETISRMTGIAMTIQDAENMLTAYFAAFPALERYIAETVTQAYTRRVVTSIAGRPRYCCLPVRSVPPRGYRSLLRRTAASVEREAVNHTIQATNADATKAAMVLVQRALVQRGLQDIHRPAPDEPRLLLSVHDELVMESPEHLVDEVADILYRSMVRGSEIAGLKTVPTVVEINIDRVWSK